MKNNRNRKNKKFTPVQKTTLFIILFLFIIVIGYLIFAITHTPENLTKSKIEKLASEYYENYLFEQFTKSNSEKPSEILEEYKTIGLSIVYLRQLLLYKNQSDAETVNYLTKHCDENKTSVKFYPEPPYNKTSYHTDYSYSCDF